MTNQTRETLEAVIGFTCLIITGICACVVAYAFGG